MVWCDITLTWTKFRITQQRLDVFKIRLASPHSRLWVRPECGVELYWFSHIAPLVVRPLSGRHLRHDGHCLLSRK